MFRVWQYCHYVHSTEYFFTLTIFKQFNSFELIRYLHSLTSTIIRSISSSFVCLYFWKNFEHYQVNIVFSEEEKNFMASFYMLFA